MLSAKGILRPMTNPANKFPVLLNLSRRRCLTAVASRDARLDNAFVYAVRSTGIYCRPSCPSRRPRPKQMQFFAIPEAAERAGVRPSLRRQLGAAAPAGTKSRSLRGLGYGEELHLLRAWAAGGARCGRGTSCGPPAARRRLRD